MIFKNRQDAGQKLAQQLLTYKNQSPFILALPRGGVVVGAQVARQLKAPFNVIIARKIGAPFNPELGIGAISENNTIIFDNSVINNLEIKESTLKMIIINETEELIRRINLYRQGKILPLLNHKTVILVDDGLATGVTAKAAIKAVKKLNPQKLVFAAPVCASDAARNISVLADDLICLLTPTDLEAISLWYQNFNQVTDDEVINLLKTVKQKRSTF